MGVINKSEHNPMGGGLQFEFRPWISELGRELPFGSKTVSTLYSKEQPKKSEYVKGGYYEDHLYTGGIGFDIYETKYLKVVPFAGWRNPFVAGLQLEYRPWISKQTDKFSVGEYFTVKAKLEMRYGYKSMEDNESDCNGADECSGLVKKEKGPRKLRPHIFGGVGFHFW